MNQTGNFTSQGQEISIPRATATVSVGNEERRAVRFTGSSREGTSNFTFGGSDNRAFPNTGQQQQQGSTYHEPPHSRVRTEHTQIAGDTAIRTHANTTIDAGEVIQTYHPRLVNTNIPHARVRTEHNQVLGPEAVHVHPRTSIITGESRRVLRYSSGNIIHTGPTSRRISPHRVVAMPVRQLSPQIGVTRTERTTVQAPTVTDEFVYQSRIELLLSRIQAQLERLGIQDDALYDDIIQTTNENWENFELERKEGLGDDGELANQTVEGLEQISQDLKNQIHLKTQSIRGLKVIIYFSFCC